MPFSRYVALGDSTTEGLDDPAPDGAGFVGFADRLAARLVREEPGLLYANLAIRGRKAGQIRAEQLEPALAMRPDLATIVGGVNDILRPRCDLRHVLGELEAMVSALRDAGATVVVMTYPDPTHVMPVARPARGRVLAFNQGLREIAERHGAVLVDLEREAIVDARLWADDRLHASSEGHERIAHAVAQALGVEPDEDPWSPLPPLEPLRRAHAMARNAVWTGRYMAPWILRRVRRRSSGDGIEPKRPELAPVDGVVGRIERA
jgi:lysophospholipase L1-like esterase